MQGQSDDGFYCKVILDSLAPCGKRLTTVEIRYPRFIHSEILTHRDRARNSASSRAIPWPKMMASITENPVIPIRWGSEQKGMQTGGEVDTERQEAANQIWLEARDNAVKSAAQLAMIGVHKSLCNRLTEPFMWITVVMTATEWANFFRLRCHPDAEIHFQKIAGLILDGLGASEPRSLDAGAWHRPYLDNIDLDLLTAFDDSQLNRISAARCARVSYLTQQGERDPNLDLDLFSRLSQGSGFGHYSPYEHVAQALNQEQRSGPFIGWHQFRKEFALENQEG